MGMAHKATALITGAAKRLGAAMAEHLAAQGYGIILHYHHSAREAKALAMRLTKHYGVAVTLVQADLSKPERLGEFFDGLPNCDVLVLNAATYERDTLATMEAATLRRQLAVNLESPLLLAQGFTQQLKKNQRGNIVVIGDGAMRWSVAPQFFSYAVSKHAWASVIDLLAAACAPHVRANGIALPPTLPALSDSKALFKRLAAQAPLKRTGSPEELLAALDFLLAAPGVTGQMISLGNGMGLGSFRPD